MIFGPTLYFVDATRGGKKITEHLVGDERRLIRGVRAHDTLEHGVRRARTNATRWTVLGRAKATAATTTTTTTTTATTTRSKAK